MAASSLSALVALVCVGQALSPERAIDAPEWWPTGGAPSVAVNDASGVLLSLTDPRTGFLRPLAFDGTLGPPARLGRVDSDGARLLRSSQGVIALYTHRNTSDFVTQLVDSATGQPIGPLRTVGRNNVSPSRVFVSGTPGRLVWSQPEYVPDAGFRTFLRKLNDDGTVGTPEVDVTGLGTITGLASTTTKHWASFGVRLPDGGANTTLHTFDDDGTDTPMATLEGSSVGLALTAAATVAAVSRGLTVTLVFVGFDGQVAGEATLPSFCSTIAMEGRGDEVWVACSEVVSFEPSTHLRLTRASPDGGVRSAMVYTSDGGELSARAMVGIDTPTPRLVFVRRYVEAGRANWTATMLLPLSADGLSATGDAVPALLRPTSQVGPGFATRQPQTSNALAWNDDRQLPDQWLLQAMRVSPEGELLGTPARLERLSSNFTSANASGRLITTAGGDFLLAAYGGFDITPIHWRSDGGAPVFRTELTGGLGIFGWPMFAGSPTDAFVVWNTYPQWLGRRLDAQGNGLGARVSLTNTGSVADTLFDGTRYLALIVEGGTLRLAAIEAANTLSTLGVVALDAGIGPARLAQSGDVLLVAWQTRSSDDLVHLAVRRVRLDGGWLDPTPTEVDQPSAQYQSNLKDIGVREGVFHVLGTQAADGGAVPWLWRIGADGTVVDPAPIVFDDLLGVTGLTAGPTVSDGELLIAYSRQRTDWPEVQRVFVRTIGDRRDAGLGCERHSDCQSNLCVEQVCCEGPGCSTPTAPSGPRIYQVCGCGLDGAPVLAAAALVALAWRRRARRRGA